MNFQTIFKKAAPRIHQAKCSASAYSFKRIYEMANAGCAIMEISPMRNELIDYLKGLADKTYQYDCWVNNKCPDNVENDELDYAVHFLFDDTNLSSDPESHIGDILKCSEEVQVIKNVCTQLSNIFEKYGYDRTDEEYICLDDWDLVVGASHKALNSIK